MSESKKRICFWVSILLFCKTQFILMAQFLYKQKLNDSVIYTAGFSDKMCSFNRCFLLLKSKTFHPLCLIYPSQTLIWPLSRTLWALHNTLLKYSYLTSRETGHRNREMFTPPISAYFSRLTQILWIPPFPSVPSTLLYCLGSLDSSNNLCIAPNLFSQNMNKRKPSLL